MSASSFSLTWRRRTFPISDFGSSSTMKTRRGTLYGVRMPRANSRIDSTSTSCAPSTTIAATTSSPECSLGRPITAASVTRGCCRSAFSTSVGATLKPPVMMSSLIRSTIRTKPASSTVTMSPVRNQPSANTASVSSGLP